MQKLHFVGRITRSVHSIDKEDIHLQHQEAACSAGRRTKSGIIQSLATNPTQESSGWAFRIIGNGPALKGFTTWEKSQIRHSSPTAPGRNHPSFDLSFNQY